MPAFTLGARYVLARQFDAESVIEQIDAEQVTHIMMVPSQIVAMLNAPNFDPARLRSLQMVLSLGRAAVGRPQGPARAGPCRASSTNCTDSPRVSSRFSIAKMPSRNVAR